jgi:hypothetical protein
LIDCASSDNPYLNALEEALLRRGLRRREPTAGRIYESVGFERATEILHIARR